MAFNRLYKHIETLIRTDEAIADEIPCKADILSVRECRKDDKVCVELLSILYLEIHQRESVLTIHVLILSFLLPIAILSCFVVNLSVAAHPKKTIRHVTILAWNS